MPVIHKAQALALRSPCLLGKEAKGTVDYRIKGNKLKTMIEAHTEFFSIAKGII